MKEFKLKDLVNYEDNRVDYILDFYPTLCCDAGFVRDTVLFNADNGIEEFFESNDIEINYDDEYSYIYLSDDETRVLVPFVSCPNSVLNTWFTREVYIYINEIREG